MSWAPSGRRWQAFSARMWAQWGPSPACFLCGHPVAPGLGEVQHQVSPSVRPDLAYSEANTRPVHGGGKRRCPEPSCGLACNVIAASNVAPRDTQGRPVPWDAAFIAAARERTKAPGRSSTGRDRRQPARKSREVPAIPARTASVHYPDAGRVWLARLTNANA